MPGISTWRSRSFVFGALVFAAIVYHVVRAYDVPSVIISEVMWAKAEYIELQNTTDADISLDGWSITRQKTVSDSEDTEVTLSATDSIPAHGFFLIESSEDATSVPSNKIKSVLGLVDTGALLQLKNASGVVVDAANRYGGWFKGENSAVGAAMERITPITAGDDAISWQTSAGAVGGRIGTPGQSTSVGVPSTAPTPTLTVSPTSAPVYSDAVYINEYMPNPVGDDTKLEFIELYNTSPDSVDISGWKLDDSIDSGSSPFTIPDATSIAGNDFIVFYSSQTKLSLNNDSDHLRLIRPDGVVARDEAYDSSKEGYSYNRTDASDFQLSTRSTPGASNSIEMPTPTPSPTPKPTATPKPTSAPISYDFSSKIVITEVYPNPSQSKVLNEFIEIKNDDNRTISLRGWTLDDEDGGSKPYHFKDTAFIGKGKILVIYKNDSKLAFNNDKDSARLVDPQGKIISSVSYAKTIAGQSYNRTDDETYEWSDTATPGNENILGVQYDTKKTSITKKAKTTKATPRVAGASRSNSPVPQAVSSPFLLWPANTPDRIIQTMVGSSPLSRNGDLKKRFFLLFCSICATIQLISGISQKEKIWFGGK